MTTTTPLAPHAARLRRATFANVDERVVWCVLAALLGLRIVLSLYRISLPGLQQDETLFVNAATLRIPAWNITASIHGIPLMIFPYISALKSWLYDPVFAVFGNSPTTIRLPAVLITSAGLVFLYPAIRDLVNRPVAVAVFAVLCFDNSLFWLTRDDVGPSALEFFFKCLALYFVARCVRELRLRWVALLVAALALGVYSKLNFIWVVNAAVVVSVLVIARHRARLRPHLRAFGVWGVGLAVLYGGFGWYYLADHIGKLSPAVHGSLLAYTWPQFELGMRGIISGTWFYGYALAPLSPRNAVVWLALILFAAGAATSLLPGRTRNLAVAALALTTLLIAAQILVTAAATAGWHYIEIYPFFTCVAAYGAYAGAQLLLRSDRGAVVSLTCVAAAMLTYGGVLMAKYDRELSHAESNPGWTSAIYKLSAYVQRSDAQIYSGDWGIANPLFALHPDRRVDELAFALEAPTPTYLLGLGRYLESIPGPKLFVAHASGETVFPQSTRNLLKSMPGHLRLVQTILGQNGKPVYLVYGYD